MDTEYILIFGEDDVFPVRSTTIKQAVRTVLKKLGYFSNKNVRSQSKVLLYNPEIGGFTDVAISVAESLLRKNNYLQLYSQTQTATIMSSKVYNVKQSSKYKIDDFGNKRWYNKRGQLHRVDGPAVELDNGSKEWYQKGQLHREDGPAIEYVDGFKAWYQNGQFHRINGPACEWANGDKEWWANNQLHREDGPAVENYNGDKFWYLNGKRHRTDGPAFEFANGNKEWYLNGQHLTEEEFLQKTTKKTKQPTQTDSSSVKSWLPKTLNAIEILQTAENRIFAHNLHQAVMKSKLDITEIEIAAQCVKGTIHQIISSTISMRPTQDMIERFANALNIEVSELWYDCIGPYLKRGELNR